MNKKAAKKKPKKPKRRADWETNEQLIEDAVVKLCLEKKKFPSYEAVARYLNMDVSTIKRHVKEISFPERFVRYRLGTPLVVANLFKQAATGKNAELIKIWLEKIEGLGSKVDVTSGGEKVQAVTGMIIK